MVLHKYYALPIILDEIQYAPELASALKRRIDKNRAPSLVIAPVEKIMRISENDKKPLVHSMCNLYKNLLHFNRNYDRKNYGIDVIFTLT